MKLREVLRHQLQEIVLPLSESSQLESQAKEIIKKLAAKNLVAKIGGSVAKGTVVKKERRQDVDIFVVFENNKKLETLEGTLKKMDLPGVLKKVHGSRDYFQIQNSSAIFEIIPVLQNTDPDLAENVTDVSLQHVTYVRGKLREYPKLADDIRLAKAFCRAQRVYGAESYINGLSGYSIELLVIYYKSFEKFLKGLGKETKQIVIDPVKHFKKADVLREINASKLQGPIVLVDPTHKYRNASAGLRGEAFKRFQKAAREFLKFPSQDFFVLKEIDISGLRRKAEKNSATFFTVKLTTDRQAGDIAGTKMKKFFDFFVDELERRCQKVLANEFDYRGSGQVASGYLVVKEEKEVECRGPSLEMEKQAKAFGKVHGKDAYEKKGYLWIKRKESVKGIFGKIKKVGKEMDVESGLK
jgi:tRNA nucleotidyltransferase (CCA-adding enzyme)